MDCNTLVLDTEAAHEISASSSPRHHRLPKGRVHDIAAHMAVAFESGVPVAINGVPLQPLELFDCVATIAAGHGIGASAVTPRDGRVARDAQRTMCEAPAAIVLRAAHQALCGSSMDPQEPANGVVRVLIDQGAYTVESVERA